MAETKHMPGWTWSYEASSEGFHADIWDENDKLIVEVFGPGAEQRAPLIAAAPELLAACEAVIPYFLGEHHPGHPHCRQLEAAIAKAKET